MYSSRHYNDIIEVEKNKYVAAKNTSARRWLVDLVFDVPPITKVKWRRTLVNSLIRIWRSVCARRGMILFQIV